MQKALHLRVRWPRALPTALVAATVIALDQVTKHLVRANLEFGELWPGGWPVRFTRVENTGSAFGLFDGQTLFLIVASAVAIAIMLYFYRQVAGTSAILRITLGLQVGGASSNLADRIRDGHVTDFIDFQKWPVFNVADSSVVIGILLLVWVVLFQDRRGPAQT
jgi:signal peptidase II